MNLKNVIRKISFITIMLFQTDFVKCSEDNYLNKVKEVAKSTEKKDWYVDFTQDQYGIKNPCSVFNDLFEIRASFSAKYSLTNVEYKKFLELILPLAQDSKKCWLNLIKKVKKSARAEYTFKDMAESALRSYVYLLIENKINWQKTVSWWRNPWQRTKLLFRGIPDFYLIAAVEELRKIEFENIDIGIKKGKEVSSLPYKDFLKDLPDKVNEYLKNIPEEFSEVQFSEPEIDNIIKNLEVKLNPSRIRRYLRYYLAAGVVVLGVGYLLYKNRTEIKGEWKKGGVTGVLKYWWQGIKNVPTRIKGTFFRKPEERKFLEYTDIKVPINEIKLAPWAKIVDINQSIASPGTRLARGLIGTSGEFIEYYPNIQTYPEETLVLEVPIDTPPMYSKYYGEGGSAPAFLGKNIFEYQKK